MATSLVILSFMVQYIVFFIPGLHKRLKDNSVPICDRVKLARFGWVSNQCFLPNKHQVLLDWVSFRLVNSEKDGTSSADEQSLWLFMHDALKSQELFTLQQEGKPICLRGNLCSALLSTLLKEDVYDIVIGCCEIILTNEKLRFVQNTKFESLVSNG
nr:unhealthy ribosome biogenesis protein 2 homolog [Lytechinus pictus]